MHSGASSSWGVIGGNVDTRSVVAGAQMDSEPSALFESSRKWFLASVWVWRVVWARFYKLRVKRVVVMALAPLYSDSDFRSIAFFGFFILQVWYCWMISVIVCNFNCVTKVGRGVVSVRWELLSGSHCQHKTDGFFRISISLFQHLWAASREKM